MNLVWEKLYVLTFSAVASLYEMKDLYSFRQVPLIREITFYKISTFDKISAHRVKTYQFGWIVREYDGFLIFRNVLI
jgi:hypothetical protein